MSTSADSRLKRLLGGDDLAKLRDRLRRHYERQPLQEGSDVVRLTALSRHEHATLSSLIGRPQRYAQSMQVDIRAIDIGLQRAAIASSLRHALEQLDGPIEHKAAIRLQTETFWAGIVADSVQPRLIQFLEAPAGLGLLKRLSGQKPDAAMRLRRQAEAILRCLPAQGIARSQLAADILGDAHGLDNGRPAATLVLAAWRQSHQSNSRGIAAISDEADNGDGDNPERIRDTWATAGVLVNELARPALFLNLPIQRELTIDQSSGEPCYGSLRWLLRSPPAWNVSDRTVYICENPNLVAIAADHCGIHCAPLVCVEGMPGAAQRCLLTQLKLAGARLLYHGDFDWPGLRIGNHVMRGYGATPWRFGAADYAAAIGKASNDRHALRGKPAEALWDGALAATMSRHGAAIAEESVAELLLLDLVQK
jgi:uncharacterized protein (TIGR02679 family)